jgi:hypothetical protein
MILAAAPSHVTGQIRLTKKKKKKHYQEIFSLLNPQGVFCNLEHVYSATENLNLKFLAATGLTPQTVDPSNELLDVEIQLGWLWKLGFVDVDCDWKWLELALLIGFEP